MKLFHKIFLCFVVIFGISFQTAGVLLIDYAYENAVEQERSTRCSSFNITNIFYSPFFTPDRISCRNRELIRKSGVYSQRLWRSMIPIKNVFIPV